MVDNKAIVKVISRITKNNGAPCKKALQKIVFLIEAKHVDLGCDYGIHFYGPYSADLDFAVRELNDEGILKIDYTPMEHLISVVGDSFENDNINSLYIENNCMNFSISLIIIISSIFVRLFSVNSLF